MDLQEWFPNFAPEGLVKIYSSFGGAPAYLENVDENKSPEENIVNLILKKNDALHDEPATPLT